jgi:hypothetical protein
MRDLKPIGYFPKRTMTRPDWLKAAGVDEICSVSTCISPAPDGWIDHWRHNEKWFYDNQELARDIVPDGEKAAFEMYAYKLYAVQFDEGRELALVIPKLDIEPWGNSFERLGVDVVSKSVAATFECSPLSCNGMAEHIAANRYCLFDGADEAFRHAAKFEAEGCEPGPYFIVEVWREVMDLSR